MAFPSFVRAVCMDTGTLLLAPTTPSCCALTSSTTPTPSISSPVVTPALLPPVRPLVTPSLFKRITTSREWSFRRKAACSIFPLDWGITHMEVFHQAYTSSDLLHPLSWTNPPFPSSSKPRCSIKVMGTSPGSEVCRSWNFGHCSSHFAICRHCHKLHYCGSQRRLQCEQPRPSCCSWSKSPPCPSYCTY